MNVSNLLFEGELKYDTSAVKLIREFALGTVKHKFSHYFRSQDEIFAGQNELIEHVAVQYLTNMSKSNLLTHVEKIKQRSRERIDDNTKIVYDGYVEIMPDAILAWDLSLSDIGVDVDIKVRDRAARHEHDILSQQISTHEIDDLFKHYFGEIVEGELRFGERLPRVVNGLIRLIMQRNTMMSYLNSFRATREEELPIRISLPYLRGGETFLVKVRAVSRDDVKSLSKDKDAIGALVDMDDHVEIHLSLDSIVNAMKNAWHGYAGADKEWQDEIRDLNNTIRHELQHATQISLSYFKKLGKKFGGMPKRKQSFKKDEEHVLREVEFYPRLSDEINECWINLAPSLVQMSSSYSEARDDHPYVFMAALKALTGAARGHEFKRKGMTAFPDYEEEVEGFIHDISTRYFFAELKKYKPSLWRKAVKLFVTEMFKRYERIIR